MHIPAEQGDWKREVFPGYKWVLSAVLQQWLTTGIFHFDKGNSYVLNSKKILACKSI